MGNSVVGSKEVIVIFIAFVLAEVVKQTGIAFPLDANQIYEAGLAIAAVIRIFWTQGKITSFLPKKPETG